jgi:hypothetical protein
VTAKNISVYRCAECGHGENLTAWGSASVHGPLTAAGTIEMFDWDEVWEVHQDSIQCEEHPGATLERLIGGQWCRWRACPLCGGDPRISCHEEAFTRADAGKYDKPAHCGWWPLSRPVPRPSYEVLGHVPLVSVDHSPRCRVCGHFLSSNTGKQPCAGDGHLCPAPVPEGDSDTARQAYGRDSWFCCQPGVMSADFTQWRCNRGHVTAFAGHVPKFRRHEDTCGRDRCPWEYLSAYPLTRKGSRP